MELENPVTRISVRNLVEFILQGGDLDSRRGTMDKEAMLKGSRLQSARLRWLPPAVTIFLWSALPDRARVCLQSGFPAFCPT